MTDPIKVETDTTHDDTSIQQYFYKETGDDLWRPAELLKTLARDGRTFASLDT